MTLLTNLEEKNLFDLLICLFIYTSFKAVTASPV